MATKTKKKKRDFAADINKIKERLDYDNSEQYTYCAYCVKKYEMSLASRDVKYIIRKKLKKHTNKNHPGMKPKEFNPMKTNKINKKKSKLKTAQQRKKQKKLSIVASMAIIQCKLIFIQFLEYAEFDDLVSCLDKKYRNDIVTFWKQYETKDKKQERENKLIAILQSYETEKNVDGMAVINKMSYNVSLEVVSTKGGISKNACSMQWAYHKNSMSFWSYFANSKNSGGAYKTMFEMENPTFFDIHKCKKIDLPYWYIMNKKDDVTYNEKPAWMKEKCFVDILHELLLPSLQPISKILMAVGRYYMSNNTRRSEYSEGFRNYYIMWVQQRSKDVRMLQIKYHTANGEYDY